MVTTRSAGTALRQDGRMDVVANMEFPADPGRVFALLTDPELHADVAQRIEATDHQLRVEGSAVTVVRVLQAPAQLAKLVGSTVSIVESVTWSEPAPVGSRTGNFTVNVEGKPVTWKGDTSLKTEGSGTVVTYSGELVVAIPFLGKALEKQAAELLQSMVAVQQEVGREHLAAAS